ncbi:Phenylalanyl-tRNA synthetase [Aphelenchoides fujianensis]|nr:Phenylalanyl-tRNA synthetase [Aphelenchoides fujianensis]
MANSIPQPVLVTLKKFKDSLTRIEEAVAQLPKLTDEERAKASFPLLPSFQPFGLQLPPLERARMDVETAEIVRKLYCMYGTTRGDHPADEENIGSAHGPRIAKRAARANVRSSLFDEAQHQNKRKEQQRAKDGEGQADVTMLLIRTARSSPLVRFVRNAASTAADRPPPSPSKTPAEIEVDGRSYATDSWYNLTPGILSLLDRKLLDEPGNPLSLLNRRIVDHFHRHHRKGGTSRSPLFAVCQQERRVVSCWENFDSLLTEQEHVSRRPSDTYYVNSDHVLRGHTSAHQHSLMQSGLDAFLGGRGRIGLKSTLESLFQSLFGSDVQMRWVDAYFPFTHPSFELEVFHDGKWLEMLGCGVMQQRLLESAGAGDKVGWAFGMGLERLAMVLYGIPDIRLFWTRDSGFLNQFKDKQPTDDLKYVPISAHPQLWMDLSFWLPPTATPTAMRADVMDVVRSVGGDLVEQVECTDEFTHPKKQRTSQTFRIVYRSHERALTEERKDWTGANANSLATAIPIAVNPADPPTFERARQDLRWQSGKETSGKS